MKIIKINLGKEIVVDDKDFERIKIRKWSTGLNKKRNQWHCPVASFNGKNIILSRFILNALPNFQVDHINRNVFDNRRTNLRLCDNSTNGHNRGLFKNNTSGFKGVYFDKYHKKWRAEIKKYKKIFLGYFKTKEEAVLAYSSRFKQIQ